MIRARIIVFAIAASVTSLVLAGRAPALAAGPEDSVQSFHETLLGAMKEGPRLGGSGRYARIEPVIHRLFDMRLMARLAIGGSWASLSPGQQQLVTAAFGAYIAATYADRFDSYSGETLQITGEQRSTTGTVITTEIVKSNGEPVHLNYLLRQNAGIWQIVDVYLNGTISQLATHRSEFSSILRTQGIGGLIVMLNTKADALAARAS